MFEIIREKKKVLLFVLLALVIPPFIVVGAGISSVQTGSQSLRV